MLIQRDSVILWLSRGSSCYLSLPFPPTCPGSQIAALPRWTKITSPPVLFHLTISVSSLALSTRIWSMFRCLIASVFVCTEMMQYPVSDLPFLPVQPKAEIFCVYACRMLSDLLSYFHCRCSLLFHTHTDTDTGTICWIRLPCSVLEGQKATDRFTVSLVSSKNSLSALLVLQLQIVVGFIWCFTFAQRPGHPVNETLFLKLRKKFKRTDKTKRVYVYVCMLF